MVGKLGTDSGEYDILERATDSMKNERGLSIEVGVREGGGSQHMIEQLLNNTVGGQCYHVAVDPYGGLPYLWKQGELASWTYDNRMRNRAMMGLYELTLGTNVNFAFYNMTDALFFEAFADGVPFYENGREVRINEYISVHLDAEHTLEALTRQVDFFAPRMVNLGKVTIDDITGYYDTEVVEAHLLASGFDVHEKGTKKAAYVKVR